jgi:hypothetical protein
LEKVLFELVEIIETVTTSMMVNAAAARSIQPKTAPSRIPPGAVFSAAVRGTRAAVATMAQIW